MAKLVDTKGVFGWKKMEEKEGEGFRVRKNLLFG